MKITKQFEGLKRIENGDYVIEGDLIATESIEIDLDDRLVVHGRIEVKKSIIANKTLIVHCGIKAGWGIEAKTYISAQKRIFAGINLYHSSAECHKDIKCKELRCGEISYGDLVISHE